MEGPHKAAHVLKEGRVYVLDAGQKVHFERLKPTELVAAPRDSDDIAVIMDPEPERSIEDIPDDHSQPSYLEEELMSDATDSSLPFGRHHWMDTRMPTIIREGGVCPYYQQFASSTDNEEESPDLYCLAPFRKVSQMNLQYLKCSSNFP